MKNRVTELEELMDPLKQAFKEELENFREKTIIFSATTNNFAKVNPNPRKHSDNRKNSTVLKKLSL